MQEKEVVRRLAGKILRGRGSLSLASAGLRIAYPWNAGPKQAAGERAVGAIVCSPTIRGAT